MRWVWLVADILPIPYLAYFAFVHFGKGGTATVSNTEMFWLCMVAVNAARAELFSGIEERWQ